MIKCSCGYRIGHPSFPKCICKRTSDWQYLTDAEIREIIGSYGDGIGAYTRKLFDKIEAKVREKNEREPKENN
jgi:hypothetical protein